jgi:magnesium chelatase family protein
VLSADRKVRAGRLEKTVLLGELALDGRVRPVRGVLPERSVHICDLVVLAVG